MRVKAIVILTGLFLLTSVGPGLAETLGEALKGRGIDVTGLDRARLARRITSFASLDDAEVFAIAYYADDGNGRLGDSLCVDLLQKRAFRWVSSELQRDEPNGVVFGGSILEVMRSGDFLYLHTHVNPSAGYTLALTTDLKYQASVYGWPLAVFPGGLLIYQNSEVHFAPTHYTEVSVFDPPTKQTWLIYPRKPYRPVRQEHIAKVRAAYTKRGENWFKEHNHHGDPERFDNYRRGEVAADPATRAVAFRMAFDNTDTWDYAEKLKFERFGGLGRILQAEAIEMRPTDFHFSTLAAWLRQIARNNLGSEFLDLFASAPGVQGMLRQALEIPDGPPETWEKSLASLDPRWGKPEIWEAMRKALATFPETTDVICILRNVDREDEVECREILGSDFEKRFGNLPLEEILTAAHLEEIFGN
jgi:hypothetical protein